MKKTLFWAASVACLCASCANDTMVEENRTADEIRFKTFAEGTTRADTVFCPSVAVPDFNLYAYDESDNLVIDGDWIKKENSGYENKSTTRYWPETGSLTFYAVHSGETSSSAKTVAFTVENAAANQKDLVYARATASKAGLAADNTDKVALNFRHALSQIVFKAKNTNSDLTVKLDEIIIGNVENSGTYSLPTTDTDTQITEGTDHEANNEWTNAGRGSWTYNNTKANYIIAPSATETLSSSETVISGANGTGALMLLPSNLEEGAEGTTAWNGTDAIYVEDKGTNTKNLDNVAGTFILVKVSISQCVNEETETPVYIWGSASETKYIAIPVSFKWEEGKRYVYTLAFGQGTSGVDPENPSDDVFVPINFTVSVDEFVSETGSFNVGGAK